MTWKPAKHKYGVAIYSYAPKNDQHLSLNIGDTLHILEDYHVQNSETEWCRGCVLKNKNVTGIFPRNHLAMKPCKIDNEGQYETVTPIEDATVSEVTYTLREWLRIWKKLFVSLDIKLSVKIREMMYDLMNSRRQLLADSLPLDQVNQIKKSVVEKLDWGNGKLGLELIPRDNGEIIDNDQLSIVKLYDIHCERVHSLTRSTSVMGSKGQIDNQNPSHHLLCNIKSFACNIGEEAEVYFSLYSWRDSKCTCISERYLCKYTKHGMPTDLEKIHDIHFRFSGLSWSDLISDLYLVAQIYRIGNMIFGESPKKGSHHKYKRPYGCAVLKLQEILTPSTKSNFEKEFTMKVITVVDAESSFPQLIENMIRKYGTKAPTTSNPGIILSLVLLQGDLDTIFLHNPLLFSKNLVEVKKLSFPEFFDPGVFRNDFYLTLHTGEFEKGSKKRPKNVEVKVIVFNCEGEQINSCTYGGCGDDPLTAYHSTIYYHNNSTKWGELIKISLSMEQFMGSHIRMEFRHCSTRFRAEKKMFGFSFLKITSINGTVIQDGVHDLLVYKCDDAGSNKLRSPASYLNLPALVDDQGSPSFMVSSPPSPAYHLSRESFSVVTNLCSTKFTQNVDVQSMLELKQNTRDVKSVLEKFLQLPGDIVVPVLPDILGVIFEMFSSSSGEDLSYLLFQALIQQTKFDNFIPILNSYIQGTINHSDHNENSMSPTLCAPLVYKNLLSCFRRQIQSVTDGGDWDFPLIDTFCVLEHIFKIIVRSKEQFNRVSMAPGQPTLLAELKGIFDLMASFLSLHDSKLMPAQEMLVKHLFTSLDILTELISEKEVCVALIGILSKLPRDMNEKLVCLKLKVLEEIIISNLFEQSECRKLVLPMCMSQVKKCLIEQTAMNSAINVLGRMLTILFEMRRKGESLTSGLNILVPALFDIMMTSLTQNIADDADTNLHLSYHPNARRSYNLQENSSSQNMGALVACIVELLRLMEDSHYNILLRNYPKGKPLKHFLLRVVQTFQILIKPDIFPDNWLVMKMVTNNVILSAVQYFAQALTENFQDQLDFDYEVWSSYFHLTVSFITQPCLQLEKFSEAKRDKLRDRYQDMRVLLGFQIHTLWQSLDDLKYHFIPSLIGPFLEVTLVPQDELRRTMLPIFYDMMSCENRRNGNFRGVEQEMIEKLDFLITNNDGDSAYRDLFEAILLEKIRGDTTLRENGTNFIQSITSLLEKLLDYRQVIDGEDNSVKRMHCTFNILNFYKADANRTEMYIRYVNKLADLHHNSGNDMEAGFALLLHSQLLRWDDEVLHAELRYPPQREWERKEMLYHEIIDYFDKGKMWEYSIPLCKELAVLYETKFDFRKLSTILTKQARFFTNILEGQNLRQNPVYYRIAYYGLPFPSFVQNKEFVYRGNECEKLGTLIHQLQTEFPAATILSSSSAPDDNMRLGTKQYIQICSVKPVPQDRPEFADHHVPKEVLNFYSVNEIDTFRLDRPYHRGERDKNNEFKTLCIERSILTTDHKLPGMLKYFEVVNTTRLQLSPLEVAIEKMSEANGELKLLLDKSRVNPDDNFMTLEMRLKGIISANVNGGIPMYQEAFLTPEFKLKYPEETHQISILQLTLIEQVNLLEEGLKMHGRQAPPELQPLHKTLETKFAKIKKGVKDVEAPRILTDSVGSNNSSPASSRGLSGKCSTASISSGESMQSLESTQSGSNRSSTTSADLIRFTHDDENIYQEPPEVPDTPGLCPGDKGRFRYCASSESLDSTPIYSRPQSVLVSHKNSREISRNDKEFRLSKSSPNVTKSAGAVLQSSLSVDDIYYEPAKITGRGVTRHASFTGPMTSSPGLPARPPRIEAVSQPSLTASPPPPVPKRHISVSSPLNEESRSRLLTVSETESGAEPPPIPPKKATPTPDVPQQKDPPQKDPPPSTPPKPDKSKRVGPGPPVPPRNR